MANNGYLVGGDCVPTANYVLSLCKSTYPGRLNYRGAHWVLENNTSIFQCRIENPVDYPSLLVSQANCEIPGPPLTETQQIEAINALFPSAIAILAIAWGFKYIRVLVAEWLKERNASD